MQNASMYFIRTQHNSSDRLDFLTRFFKPESICILNRVFKPPMTEEISNLFISGCQGRNDILDLMGLRTFNKTRHIETSQILNELITYVNTLEADEDKDNVYVDIFKQLNANRLYLFDYKHVRKTALAKLKQYTGHLQN